MPSTLRDVVDRRRLHAAQAAEVREQRLPALRADARDLLQHRRGARLAARARGGPDREAMRLVADLLDQVQCRDGRRQLQAAAPAGSMISSSRPGLRSAPLATPTSGTSVQARARPALRTRCRPALAAVDQHQVGNLAGLGGDALVAPRRAPRASRA